MSKEGAILKNYLKGKGLQINVVADKMGMTRQNLSYHFAKDVLELDFLRTMIRKLKLNERELVTALGYNPGELNEEGIGYGDVSLKDKVIAHDALFSVLVPEIASLISRQSGEPVQSIIMKLYKAAEGAGETFAG
jgi:hypothetical protein